MDAATGSQCLPCEPGTFNFDGLACRACPFGVHTLYLDPYPNPKTTLTLFLPSILP